MCRWIVLWLLLGAQTSFAVDYDYARAYDEWQSLQSIADAREIDWQREQRALAPLQSAFDRAAQDVQRWERQLIDIRSRIRDKQTAIATARSTIERWEDEREQLEFTNRSLLTRIDALRSDHDRLVRVIDDLTAEKRRVEARIRALESQPSDGDWTCIYVDRGHEEHRGGHPATDANRSTAASQAEASCLSFHGACALHSCTQPANDELSRLRQRRDDLARDISTRENELARIDSDLRRVESNYQANQDAIANINRRLPEVRSDLRTYEDDLRRLQFDENDKELALARARTDLADARAARDRGQIAVDRAYANFLDASQRAQRAQAYYQEVRANYDRALAAAEAQGRSQGSRDGYREASERAATPAQNAAQTAATRDGTVKGSAEATAISQARGYRYGRDNARTQASYAQGVTGGEAIAQDKAAGEHFPRGYNTSLLADLASEPSAIETIDIGELLPDLPDEGGVLLSPDQKPIRQVAEPAFGYVEEPEFSPPEPTTQSVQAPTTDRRYFAPQCSGQALPAFEQACRDQYQSAYVGGFAESYRNAYNEKFKAIYRDTVPAIYRAARDQRDAAAYASGTALGARDQGILDGFAGAIDAAVVSAYRSGQRAYDDYEQTGYLPLVKAVEIVENYEDGNLSPGENMTLRVTINNFGALATSPEKLGVQIDDLSGGTFNLAIRNLPALAADTTTILEGVLKGTVTADDGGNLRFKVTLTSADGAVLDQAVFAGSVQAPIVLSRIAFPDPVRIGEPAQGLLYLANRTQRATEATTALLSVAPEILELTDPDLSLPGIEAGDELSVPFDFVADARAGGNLALQFKLAIAEISGSRDVVVGQATSVPITRNGSLDLCLPTCGAPVTLPLRVRAGSTLQIPVAFNFHATTRQPGPFVLGKLGQSDARIRGANGSTVRANLGAWGPNNSVYRANFGYVIPLELRGQNHWVSLHLDDGRNRIHLVEIPFVVE